MLVAQDEVEIVRNLFSQHAPTPLSLKSRLLPLLLLNIGSSLLFIFDGILTLNGFNLVHWLLENKFQIIFL
jgi:hypothetical protein